MAQSALVEGFEVRPAAVFSQDFLPSMLRGCCEQELHSAVKQGQTASMRDVLHRFPQSVRGRGEVSAGALRPSALNLVTASCYCAVVHVG